MLFPYPVIIPYNNTDNNIVDYTLNSNQMDKFKTIYILIVFINILVAIFFILKFIIELKKYNTTINILNNKDELSFNLIIEKNNLVCSIIIAIISLFVIIFLIICYFIWLY